jgi:phosphosulfolactate phosphohydrolase-like enzyme
VFGEGATTGVFIVIIRATAIVETAVKNSATTIATVRERSARLYTGNFIPL